MEFMEIMEILEIMEIFYNKVYFMLFLINCWNKKYKKYTIDIYIVNLIFWWIYLFEFFDEFEPFNNYYQLLFIIIFAVSFSKTIH